MTQQGLLHILAAGEPVGAVGNEPGERERGDFVVYDAPWWGGLLRCEAMFLPVCRIGLSRARTRARRSMLFERNVQWLANFLWRAYRESRGAMWLAGRTAACCWPIWAQMSSRSKTPRAAIRCVRGRRSAMATARTSPRSIATSVR